MTDPKNHFQNINTKFLLHLGNEFESIDLNQVTFCKSGGNYTEFHFLNEKKKLASNALKFYDKLFVEKGFFRLNRFYLIHIKNVKRIHKRETIVMLDDTVIHVSSRNRDRLRVLIENFNQ